MKKSLSSALLIVAVVVICMFSHAAFALKFKGSRQNANATMKVVYTIDPYPVRVGESVISYSIYDRNDQKLTNISSIETKLWMPEHKHGSKPIKTQRLPEPGEFDFETKGAYFIMHGPWEIIINYQTSTGFEDSFSIPVEAAR